MPWRFNPFTGNLDETDIPAFNGEVTLGSATSPSIFFTGDTNTGIYSPGADQLALSTNGTGRLFVDASGGTRIEAVTIPLVASRNAVGSALGGLILRQSDTTNGNGLRISYQSDTTGAGAASNVDFAGIQFSADIHDQATRAGSIRFLTSQGGVGDSQERLRITSAGLVGIGTSVPSAKLHVVDDKASLALRIGSLAAGTSFDAKGYLTNDAGTKPTNDIPYFSISGLSKNTNNASTYDGGIEMRLIATGVGNTYGSILRFFTSQDSYTNTNRGVERLRIDHLGRVGIGTTGPSSLLHIEGTFGSFRLNGTASAFSDYRIGGTNIGYTGDAGFLFSGSSADFGVRATNNLAFGIGASEKARIDSSGRLLVGTASDSGGALLQVNGDRVRIATAKTPASASATGTAGEVCWDTNYIYVCTATNTWKRAALSTW